MNIELPVKFEDNIFKFNRQLMTKAEKCWENKSLEILIEAMGLYKKHLNINVFELLICCLLNLPPINIEAMYFLK